MGNIEEEQKKGIIKEEQKMGNIEEEQKLGNIIRNVNNGQHNTKCKQWAT